MTKLNEKRVGVISLGCDKNRVDSEKMLAILNERYVVTNDISTANIVIINTCAFLESARAEAISTIFEVNEYRTSGNLEKIIVTGCLPQKFANDIFEDLFEVDAFLGINDYDLIHSAIESIYLGNRVNFVGKNKNFYKKERILTTVCHYSYLKIADGCNNKCTYCLIPKIRGEYNSTKIELLIDEAKELGELDELILVAQDVTRYGVDLYGKSQIVTLIKKLSELENINKIRLLYCYPDMISDELINENKTNDKVIKYLDIPLQHADDKILKLMNRKGTGSEYLSLIEKLRTEIPDIAIRSTFITGFPCEDENAFNNLVEFIKKAKLTNCGF
ncbi:MAG: MiaB/RimO family radical SAM methylthiotransferase, partial [Clostridia bacterium]|nr:MiaB/RimO family radical SAM methylthiotransferase [Clostridia bacterium]